MNDSQYEYGIDKATTVIIGIASKVILVVIALVLLYLGIRYGFSFGRSLFYVDPAENTPGRDVEITVTEYDTYESLAQKLYESGVISDELSFRVQATLYQADLYPGTYTVNSSQTIKDIILAMEESALDYESEAESQAAIEAASETAQEVLTGGGEGD